MNHLLQKVKLDQLAERIVLNDVKAETDFYNYVYFNLLLKVKKIIKNHQDAEEITLDIINNVIKRIKEEKIDNLESYLMGTTKKM